MPTGYRYVILAAFGFLVSAAPSPPREEAAREARQTQRGIAESLRSIDATLKHANKPNEETKPCPKGEDNRQSDLCAQWKAADASAESSLWTERTFYLGVGGFLVGLLTLGAAGAAAYFAWSAAEQARRSNILNMRENARTSRRSAASAHETAQALLYARKSADEARRTADTAERQLVLTQRAFIFIKPDTNKAILPDNTLGGIRVVMEMRNTGQTEAVNVRNTFSGDIRQSLPANFDFPPGDESQRDVIPAHMGPTYYGEGKAYGEAWERIKRGESLFVWGTVAYNDIFTTTDHVVQFCYRIMVDGHGADPANWSFRSERYGSYNQMYDVEN